MARGAGVTDRDRKPAQWIDLLFGCALPFQSSEALAAANIFYPITYEDNLVRLLQNEEDERMLASHLLQAYEFVAARPRPSQSLTRSGNEQERATPPPRLETKTVTTQTDDPPPAFAAWRSGPVCHAPSWIARR